VLSLARCDHRLHRRGLDILELELVNGQMMANPFETMYRADDEPLRVGATIELTGLRVSVIAVAERGPTRISFQFDRPLTWQRP
jgi:glutamine cyclotransferase